MVRSRCGALDVDSIDWLLAAKIAVRALLIGMSSIVLAIFASAYLKEAEDQGDF